MQTNQSGFVQLSLMDYLNYGDVFTVEGVEESMVSVVKSFKLNRDVNTTILVFHSPYIPHFDVLIQIVNGTNFKKAAST